MDRPTGSLRPVKSSSHARLPIVVKLIGGGWALSLRDPKCRGICRLACIGLFCSRFGLATLSVTGYAADAPKPNSAPEPERDVITGMKELEQKLGFERTGNFLTRSDKIAAYYRCYYTGKLELPSSYDDLQLKQVNKPECAVDADKYDVFFYRIEAVANGKSPVTSSLEGSSIERLLVVVPHEDFHEHKEAQKLPASFTEAASTLVGFLTAGEFAKDKFGMDSEVYRNLSKEPDLFERKAELVNRYYPEFGNLYSGVRAGQMTREEALASKQNLFLRMEEECQAIAPDPTSFNKCLAAGNNAGLAFDFTYTKYYPLFYELFIAQGRQARPTIEAVKRALTVKSLSEPEAVRLLRESIDAQNQKRGEPKRAVPAGQ